MLSDKCIEILGQWEGYVLGSVGREGSEEDPQQIWIELLPDPTRLKRCSGCSQVVNAVHDSEERWIRDLPILDCTTWLLVHRCRVLCPDCGPRVEELEWLGLHSRYTRRFCESVARLCKHLPIKQVADWFGLGWHATKRIDKESLQDQLGPVDFDGVEVLAMDEFAIQTGHRYATVVLDPTNKRVLWVGRGRSRESIRPFFKQMGPKACEKIKAVVMDMTAAYELEVKEHCKNAEVVFDLFHVVAKYGREVIDRVRVDEANRLRADKAARKVVKGSRWLLLRNSENLRSREERVKLKDLLKANKRLLTVYVLKEDLKHLWDYRYSGAALRFWKSWYSRAIRSRIEPLKKFAKALRRYLPGILAHARWPLHTSVLEGVNNKIKVIKRMAYGFRDDDYFFLKIRAAFPGNHR